MCLFLNIWQSIGPPNRHFIDFSVSYFHLFSVFNNFIRSMTKNRKTLIVPKRIPLIMPI